MSEVEMSADILSANECRQDVRRRYVVLQNVMVTKLLMQLHHTLKIN